MNWKGELYELLDCDLIYDVIDLFQQDTWGQRIQLLCSIGLKIYCIKHNKSKNTLNK